jgi:signal transduction histidine kinase
MTTARPGARRGVFAAEVAVLLAATAADAVLMLRTARPTGFTTSVLDMIVPYAGSAAAVLAALRRRFPRRIELLAAAVIGLSVLSTAGRLASNQFSAHPVITETVAAALLVGAACRRLAPTRAVPIAVAACVAVVAAPILRYGVNSPMALFAAPAALLWGIALAIGLILRDADARQHRELALARTNDRLDLARELHDLVAHHVSGIVVRIRAARSLAEQDPTEVYGEIEEAAAASLVAMRELVGMLRDPAEPLVSPVSSLGEVVRAAAAGRAMVDVASEVDAQPLPRKVVVTLHRVVLEALTNAHRHAKHPTEIRVRAWRDNNDLVLDIGNDGVRPEAVRNAGAGYGIIGMTERLGALGGTLKAGPRPGGRWHVTARLALGTETKPFPNVPKGV